MELLALSGFGMIFSPGPRSTGVPMAGRGGLAFYSMLLKYFFTQGPAAAGPKSPVTTTVMRSGT